MEDYMQEKQPINTWSNDHVMRWATAQLGTLHELMQWAGWGFPIGASSEVARDYDARCERRRLARLEAVRRGLVAPETKWETR